MMRYHEALSRCLEALAEGRDLEAVLAELPERHRQVLREDATLAAAVSRHASTIPAPGANAEVDALSKLNAELNTVRVERRTSSPRGGFAPLPRFALAGLLLAALLIGASFLIGPNRGDDGTVEAAEFEGVVVANAGGSLTVQTLDTLEQVMVPVDASVLNEDGTLLELGAIAEGEVILVRGDRAGNGPVMAFDVRRLVNGLPGWCDENGERCRRIAEGLRDAEARCETNTEVCQRLRDHVGDVISRVTDVADLEDLKQRCRAGGEGCRDITSFCRDHADACLRDIPRGPVIDRLDDARTRLQQLDGLCDDRDTRACRQIAQLCSDHPALCSDAPVRPAPSPNQRPSR